MRFLQLHSSREAMAKEAIQTLTTLLFKNSEASKDADKAEEFEDSLKSLVLNLFSQNQLIELINFSHEYLKDRNDEQRFEVFKYWATMYLMKYDSIDRSQIITLILGQIEALFEDKGLGAQTLGMMLNIEKHDLVLRRQIFASLFGYCDKNELTVLYKYCFDLTQVVTELEPSLELAVLDYALRISHEKGLWEDFTKLLRKKALILDQQSSEALEDSKSKLKTQIDQLLGSREGIFYFKSVRSTQSISNLVNENEKLKNLVQALDSADIEVLSENNKTPENETKINLVKLINACLKKANWRISDLSKEIFKDEGKTKETQSLLMRGMKNKFIKAKINRKNESLIVSEVYKTYDRKSNREQILEGLNQIYKQWEGKR